MKYTHIESFARLYKDFGIDPRQPVRLFLIAPSFSQAFVNRCKWLDLKVSLFTYNCLKFEGEADVVPIFTEQPITALPESVEVTHLEDHLNYITDTVVRQKVAALLEEIKSWKPGHISIDSIKYALSMKVNGRVFAYLNPRRQFYVISTYDASDEWREFAVKTDEELAAVRPIVKAAMERRIEA
jgi:hypothetical protein